APSWPWPLITNGAFPARLRTHIRSSIARDSATVRYMARRSSSVSPAEAARALVAVLRPSPVTVMRSSASEPLPVDRPPVDGHRALAQDLRQRRVRVGRETDLPRRRLEREGERALRDEVRRVRADDVDPERVLRLGVRDDLRESLVLAADEGL